MDEREETIRETWSGIRERALKELDGSRPRQYEAMPFMKLPPIAPGTSELEVQCETIVYTREQLASGASRIVSDGVVVEEIPAPRFDIWGNADMYKLALYLNHLKVGDKVRVPVDVLSRMSYNSWAYSDLWHALRGNLIGSSYGSFSKEDRGRDGWIITRREEGKRIYDRDGYPVRE